MNNSQMWSLDDFEEGLCTGEQVGTPRTAPDGSTPVEDEHDLLAEVRRMGGNPESLAEVGMLLYRKNPEGFMADYPSIFNKLVDLQQQQATKDAEKQSGYWTPERVRYLNSHRMKAIVLLAVEKFIPSARLAEFRAEVEQQNEAEAV